MNTVIAESVLRIVAKRRDLRTTVGHDSRTLMYQLTRFIRDERQARQSAAPIAKGWGHRPTSVKMQRSAESHRVPPSNRRSVGMYSAATRRWRCAPLVVTAVTLVGCGGGENNDAERATEPFFEVRTELAGVSSRAGPVSILLHDEVERCDGKGDGLRDIIRPRVKTYSGRVTADQSAACPVSRDEKLDCIQPLGHAVDEDHCVLTWEPDLRHMK